jgi:hypothetical protein
MAISFMLPVFAGMELHHPQYSAHHKKEKYGIQQYVLSQREDTNI